MYHKFVWLWGIVGCVTITERSTSYVHSQICLLKNWGCSIAFNGSHLKRKHYRIYNSSFWISDTSSLACWKMMFSISDSWTLIFTVRRLLLWNVYQCTCNCKTCKINKGKTKFNAQLSWEKFQSSVMVPFMSSFVLSQEWSALFQSLITSSHLLKCHLLTMENGRRKKVRLRH